MSKSVVKAKATGSEVTLSSSLALASSSISPELATGDGTIVVPGMAFAAIFGVIGLL